MYIMTSEMYIYDITMNAFAFTNSLFTVYCPPHGSGVL